MTFGPEQKLGLILASTIQPQSSRNWSVRSGLQRERSMTKKVKVNARTKKGGGIIADNKQMSHRHFKRDVDRAMRYRPKQQQQPRPEGFA